MICKSMEEMQNEVVANRGNEIIATLLQKGDSPRQIHEKYKFPMNLILKVQQETMLAENITESPDVNRNLGVQEQRFAHLIWDMAPVKSSVLVSIAKKTLNWKPPTTHTVITRLCNKGLFCRNEGVVFAKVSRNQYSAYKARKLVADCFSGSLYSFLKSYLSVCNISSEDADQIRRLFYTDEKN